MTGVYCCVLVVIWCFIYGIAFELHSCDDPKLKNNRIVQENCLKGTPSTEWDVNGAGDESIQGFTTDISVNLGEKVEFKIKTPSTKYRIDIYRLGYYNGTGARHVDTIRPFVGLPQLQPACYEDKATYLYDCDTWNVSAVWNVPANAVSGLYIGRPVREDEVKDDFGREGKNWRADNSQKAGDKIHARPGDDMYAPPKSELHAYGANGFGKLRNALREPRASHIYFIVRDDSSTSDVLFQTADTTWQAYNGYGGLTTYGSFLFPFTHGPEKKPMNLTGPSPRAFKASYNRPLSTRGYRAVNAPLDSEYPAIRFLEAAGYDITYFSGVDASRYGELIRRHKLYLSVGHDEYVSYEQREHVTKARELGVSLAFFSGNEFYWAIRFENSSASGKSKSHRTMVCYKETQSNVKLDPLPGSWTGTFRDNRDINPRGAMPENALTGTIFTVNAQRFDSLSVPFAYSALRYWKNTEVAELKKGEVYRTFRGVLSHEWDEDLDNGFRPEGLIRLSETIVDNVQYIQDHGSVFDSGSGRHTLTLYKHGQALVFGTGTVRWAWSLDNHHDINDPPRANPYNTRVTFDSLGADAALQQLTVNIFAEMQVQPSTLGNLKNVQEREILPGKLTIDHKPPKINHLYYSHPEATSVLVEVEASDDAGTVASVEISLNGGKTWHPAERKDEFGKNWRFQFDSAGFQNMYFQYSMKELEIAARAIDDSFNFSPVVFAQIDECESLERG